MHMQIGMSKMSFMPKIGRIACALLTCMANIVCTVGKSIKCYKKEDIDGQK